MDFDRALGGALGALKGDRAEDEVELFGEAEEVLLDAREALVEAVSVSFGFVESEGECLDVFLKHQSPPRCGSKLAGSRRFRTRGMV